MESKRLLTEERDIFLAVLKDRFEKHMYRHEEIDWDSVQTRLEESPEKLWSLYEMDRTGGEPDIVDYDQANDLFVFFDCSKESPKGRRSCCYDLAGLQSRKKHQPEHNAIDLAKSMGIELLNEDEYKYLQSLGEFDLKTSTWILTPENIRKLGGALFCDRRYNHVFTYHNGAQSYYGSRGFRGMLKV